MSQGETAYWQREAGRTEISPAMAEVFERAREMGGPVLPGAHAACAEGDILVDGEPIPLVTGCCEGGRCQPKAETRMYQAKDSTGSTVFPQTTHFERVELPADPLKVQVGGEHYKGMPIQPAEFIHANGIGFLAGNVIKYVCRAKQKGGAEDLKKAIHYLELLIHLEYEG